MIRPTTASVTIRGRPAEYPPTAMMRLPYPLRNVLRRWRGMVGMMIGVGIALAVVMTLQAMGRANLEIFTADDLESGADLDVVTQGGTLIPALAGDTPGTNTIPSSSTSSVRPSSSARA